MVSYGACNPHKRIFRVLKTLPFFQALCGRGDMVGVVPFDPTSERTSFLIAWLEYRLPGSRAWTTTLPRPALERTTIRDILLHGTSPGIGTFLNWDPATASLDFIRSFLSWYGIVPSPDEHMTARSEAWWRSTAGAQLVSTGTSIAIARLTPRNARASDISLALLVRAAATTRAMRGRLMEAFELVDDRALSRLSPRDFEILLRTLASEQFPLDDGKHSILLSSETADEQYQADIEWQVGRQLRALRAKTGTAMQELHMYVEAKKTGIRSTRARLAVDPRSSSAVNSEFYARHGLTVALKSAQVGSKVGVFIVTGMVARKLGKETRKITGWQHSGKVANSLVSLGLAVHTKNPKAAATAVAALILYLRQALITRSAKASDTTSSSVESPLVQALLKAAVPELLSMWQSRTV